MQELRQSTQVLVVIGPVVAVGDGFTPVTSLDLSTADEAEILKHDTSSVTSIAAATFAAITSADGYYVLTITTSLSDTLGMMTVAINDDSLCLPVKAQFMVLSPSAWDRKYSAQSQVLQGIAAYGTAQAATGTTIQLASGETFADDTPIGMIVVATGSTQGYPQSRVITDYVLATDTATVDTWTVTPSGTITYVVVPAAPGSLTNPVPASLGTGAITNATFAAGAIDATAVADGAIDAGALAANTITAAKFAAGAIDAAAIANGAIDAATFAANAITSTVIADNAITAAKIATAALPSAKFDEADPVPVNVVEVNDVVVDGDGESGSEWGPA